MNCSFKKKLIQTNKVNRFWTFFLYRKKNCAHDLCVSFVCRINHDLNIKTKKWINHSFIYLIKDFLLNSNGVRKYKIRRTIRLTNEQAKHKCGMMKNTEDMSFASWLRSWELEWSNGYLKLEENEATIT